MKGASSKVKEKGGRAREKRRGEIERQTEKEGPTQEFEREVYCYVGKKREIERYIFRLSVRKKEIQRYIYLD